MPYQAASPVVIKVIDEATALLAIPYAQQRDQVRARQLFAKAKPRLLAQNNTKLLTAYFEADPKTDAIVNEESP